MKHDDLPIRWKQKLEAHLASRPGAYRNKLSASDFSSSTTAKLVFEDGSSAEFYYALIIEAPELNEVGVFTEHCGYFFFPIGSVEISISSAQ